MGLFMQVTPADTHSTIQLPTELWGVIFAYLPRRELRTCLSIGRLFHDLALSSLFSTARIRFGSWLVVYEVRREVQEGYADENGTSFLLSISMNPGLASCIKHFDVLAFAPHDDCSFEMECLTRAVAAMRNLRTLRWYTAQNAYMIPSERFLGTIASSTQLRECSLPFECVDVLANLGPFPHLTGLSLDVLPLGQRNESLDVALYERCAFNFKSLLDIYAQAPLAALSVPGEVATTLCPKQTLCNLTHLALRNPRHLRHFDSVLEHCVCLESFWISWCDHDGTIPDISALFQVLKAHPDALPRLTHLKFTISGSEPQSIDTLAAFIAPKKHLRCLDWEDAYISTAQLLPLLAVLPSLPALQVLGLHLTTINDDMAGWMRSGALNAFIPERATALRFAFDHFSAHAPRGRCWEELWARVTNLGFLWIADMLGARIADTHELVASAKSLRILGHRELFYDVEHKNGEAVLSPPWLPTKITFRSVEDFGNADWEWLMRGHLVLL